jgi:hypothetical protein
MDKDIRLSSVEGAVLDTNIQHVEEKLREKLRSVHSKNKRIKFFLAVLRAIVNPFSLFSHFRA